MINFGPYWRGATKIQNDSRFIVDTQRGVRRGHIRDGLPARRLAWWYGRALTRRVTDTDEGHSQRYIERFRRMAAEGADLAGEARLVDTLASPGSRILDAGCGPAGWVRSCTTAVITSSAWTWIPS